MMRDSKPSTYDLLEMHIRALYVHDEQSRLLSINDWQGGVAPRFFLGRTNQGNLWRFRHDLSQAVCEELESLCKTETFSAFERPRHEADYVRILSVQAPVEKVWFGFAFWFANAAMDAEEPIQINEQNANLLQDGLQEWLPDIDYQQPMVALVVDGRAVAICASVRITKAAHEAGVETVEAHRGKGYAVKVVVAWAREVRKLGALPFYSLSDQNLASKKVANRLGLSKIGVAFHIT